MNIKKKDAAILKNNCLINLIENLYNWNNSTQVSLIILMDSLYDVARPHTHTPYS